MSFNKTVKKLNRQTENTYIASRAASGSVSISKAAKFLSVSPDTLRNWESQKKFVPKRTAGGARRYDLEQLISYKKFLNPLPQTPTGQLSVSKAASELRVSPDTIRNWDKKGIIKGSRTKGGSRRFSRTEIRRLQEELNIKRDHSDSNLLKTSNSAQMHPNLILSEERDVLATNPLVYASNIGLEKDIAQQQNEVPILDTNRLQIPRLKLFTVLLGVFLLFTISGILLTISLISKENQKISSILSRIPFISPLTARLQPETLKLPQTPSLATLSAPGSAPIKSGSVLAESSPSGSFLQINLDTEITGDASISGTLTAPNILYSLTPGTDISITGDPQRPTISSTLTIADATTSVKGIASFSDSFFTLTSGAVSLKEGGITTTEIKNGTIANGDLASSSITISPGSGISGGGAVSLGGSVTITSVLGSTVSLTSEVEGVLPIANGGSNKALTLAAGGVLWTDSDSFEVTAAGTSGQVLTSAGTGAPTWTTVGAGICPTCVVTNPASSQTITGSAATVIGLSIAQPSSGSVDVFNVTNNAGTTEFLSVDSTGDVAMAQDLTISGTTTSTSTLTASNGFTVTTGAVNITATSGALTLSGLSASSVNTGANNITFTSGNFNTTATGINSTAIGQTTAAAGSFTTLSSTGVTTIGNDSASVAIDSSDWNITTAGAISNATYEGLTISTTTGTLTIAAGKTLTASNTITFTGTDATSFAFPSTSDTVVTLTATQTLTNKSLTSPTITTSPTAAGATWTDLGTVTTADINGGTIDGTVIGGASAAAGSFTTVTTSSTINLNTFTSTALTFAGASPAISASTAGTNISLDAGTSGAVNIAGTSTGDINLGGGSASTGCTVTNATGALACSGNITGGSTGTVGFWTRTSTTLDPATDNDVVSIPTTNTTGADLAITNTGVYTGTGIFNLTANSANTGIVAAVTADGLTSGTALALSSGAAAFNGELLTLSKTASAGETAFTSDIANVAYSQTFNGGVGLNSTGNVLDISRAITLNNAGNTHTISGALVSISDTMTQTAGTLTHTASVLDLTQNYTSSTGTTLYVKSYGGDTGLAFRVDDVSGDTTPFVIENTGEVGIGTTAPATTLDIDTGSNTLGLRLRGTAETTEIADMYVGSNGELIVSTTAGADTAQYIDLRPEDNEYGVVIRDGSGAATDPFLNIYVNDAATDYVNLVANTTNATTGLVITANQNVGVGTTVPAGYLDISANVSGTPSSTVGRYLSISASTFTDNNTAASGTATGMAFNSIAAPTLAATNANVTTTSAYTLWIDGGPAAGTNQTITQSYALGLGGRFVHNGAGGALNDYPYMDIQPWRTVSSTDNYGVQIVNFGRGALTRNYGLEVGISSGSGAYTMTDGAGIHIRSSTKGTGVTLTNGYGVIIDAQTGGTNTTGVAIGEASSSGNDTNLLIGTTTIPSGDYSIYNSSTKQNYFAGNTGIGDVDPDAKLDIDSTSTTGLDFLITNTGVGLSGTVATVTANSYTTGDIFSLNGTALTTGSLAVLTGPSGGTAGVTDAALKITSDVGNIGTSNGLISSTATIDSTSDSISGVNLYLNTASSQALGTTIGQTYYGMYNTLTKTGADTTSGTITSYGTYSIASNTGGDTAGTRNTYGGYFSATGDASGTTKAIGLYATASGADNNYAAIFEAGNVGIGTTAPGTPLDVVSNSSSYGIYQRGRASDNFGTMSFGPNAGGTSYFDIQVGATTFDIRSGSAVSYIMVSSGNVGIGQTAPAAQLDVLAIAASTGINLAGTAPASVAGNGTNAATNTLLVVGTAGGASSGTTGQTGGTGGALSLTGGIGGAVAGASGIGGVGGGVTLAGGAGGNGAATGGAGGALTITAGAAGTGGNANGGTLTLNSGAVTGSGTSTLSIASSNTTTLNLGTSASAATINLGPTSTVGSIVMSGGSADTGCTLDGTTGNLTCAGTVSSAGAGGAVPINQIAAATGTATRAHANNAIVWNWGTLTTETGMTFGGGTAMTTGSIFTLGGATYVHTALNDTGSLVSLSFTDASTNANNGGVTNGISIASTINTTGAGTKNINGISIASPTKTACTTGACTWTGLAVADPGTLTNTTFYAATFAGGNVGIGTTAPVGLLGIQSDNTGYKTFLRLTSTGASGGTQNGIEWFNGNPNTVSAAIYSQPGGGYTTPSFAIDVGGVGSRVVDVFSTGVGILTAGNTPGAALEVTGNILLTKEAARTITVGNSTTANTAGGALTINSGAGIGTTATAAGGALSLASGAGGALSATASTAGAGGAFGITGGNGGATSGVVTGSTIGGAGSTLTFTAGEGGAATGGSVANTAGAGGAITLQAGNAGAASGTGPVGAAGGAINLTGGTGNLALAGGAISLTGGTGGATGAGGAISIIAGTAGATSGTGGILTLGAGAGGVGSNTGRGGAATFRGGEGSLGWGGAATFRGGDSIDNGAGGAVTLRGGDVNGNEDAGGVTIRGGNVSTNAGNPGAITITGGNAGSTAAGGAITITTGNGGGTSGNSGTLTLDTGTVTSGTVGPINIGTSARARTITLGNSTGATALALTSGTGSQTFTSSVATGTTTTSGFVFDATAITSGTGLYLTTDSVTTGRVLDIATTGNTWTGNGTTNGLINIASTSTAGTISSSSILLNLARSGANANASHTAYGIYSDVTNTGTTNTNIAGYFSATGASTSNTGINVNSISTSAANNRSILLGSLTGGTTLNYHIMAGAITSIDGAANYYLSLGAISGGGATATNGIIDAGNISATGGNNFGLRLGTLTGGSSTNYQITTGALTTIASSTSYQANFGAVTGAASATFGGINIGAISGAGTQSAGIVIGANSSTATTNYGINVGAISGAGTTNIGLNIGAVSGATSNYALITNGGNVGIGDTSPSALVEIGNGTDSLQVSSVGDMTFVDADDGASITGPAGGSLAIAAANSQALALSTTTAGNITLTPAAATGLVNVLTGNLKVGAGTPGVSLNGDDAYITGTFEVDGATTFDGTLTTNSTLTANTDVDLVFAGSENMTITNTTNTLGASGMLDLASTSSTTDTRTLDLSTTFTSTGATNSYGLYNTWASSAVVTGAAVSQTAYGSYNTATKTGADDATGTYTLYGSYNTASNTGRTAAGTVDTYGGYFSAAGDASGATTTYGLYTTASGADTNYGLYVAAGNVFSAGVFLGPSGATGAPAYSFSGDPNTGIWQDSGDTIKVSTGGTARFYLSDSSIRFFTASTGDVQISNSSTLTFSSNDSAGDTNLYRSAANTLKTDDSLLVAATSGSAFGGAGQAASILRITGSLADGYGVYFDPTLNPADGTSGRAFYLGPTITADAGETHSEGSTFFIGAPAKGGTGTITDFATLRILGAPIGGANNYGIYMLAGDQPTAVLGATGTNAGSTITALSATGGNTTIATTGTGGIGGAFSFTGGTGGTAASANTASTGGAGGAYTVLAGTGGAAEATGTNVGGAGGALSLTAGTGGAASGGTGNTGGAGGAIAILAGAAGSGGNANGGTLSLNSGAVTGTGTSTINLGTSNTTNFEIGDSTVTKTIDLGGITSSAADTINIATNGTAADTLAIGNTNASTTIAITGGNDWSITAAGAATFASTLIASNGFTVTTGTVSITASDGSFVDLSAVNGSSTTEGLKLPQATDCTTQTAEGLICWDTDGDALRVGNGATTTAFTASPFVATTGVIDYATATDRLKLTVGEVGDIGLEVLGKANQTAAGIFIDAATNAYAGTSGALDMNVTTLTHDSRGLDLAFTSTAAGATATVTQYGIASTLTSTQAVTATSPTFNYYGTYQTVSKSGADNLTTGGTFNTYGVYGTASNTSTDAGAAGTRSTYGGYFSATGAAGGATTAIGLYATAASADNNYAAIFDAGNVGIGITTPATVLDIDSNSNTQSLRIRGADGSVADGENEIGELYVGTGGELIISTKTGSDTSQYIDLYPEDNEYGVIIRDGAGGAGGSFTNFYMNDTTIDYLNIVSNTTNATAGLVLDANQNVGINTTDPDADLELSGALGTGNNFDLYSDYILILRDEGLSTTSYGVGVDDTGQIQWNTNGTYGWFKSGTSIANLDGSGNLTISGECNDATAGTTCADYAEVYQKDINDPLDKGDLLAFNKQTGKVTKAGAPNSSEIMGVYSTSPGSLIGHNTGVHLGAGSVDNLAQDEVPVALTGRVPLKVSAENGPIEIGDYLTLSSIPGVAMKATRPGPTVGKALENHSGSEIKKIMTFVNVSFADPSNTLANLTLDSDGSLIIPKLKAEKIVVSSELVVGSLKTNSVSIDTSSLNMTGSLASITPDSEGKVSIAQALNAISDQQSAISSQVLGLESASASQSAQIAQSSQIAQQAVAQAQSLDEKVASTSANLASLSEQIQDLLNQTSGSSASSNSFDSSGLTPPDLLTATGSASLTTGGSGILANLDITDSLSTLRFSSLDATVSATFKSLGESFLGNTTVAGDLTVDGTLSFSQNSINAISTLYLQNNPLSSSIDIFNGLITLSKDGVLNAKEIITDKISVTDKSAGSGIIPAGQTQVSIPNGLVTADSIVIITPETVTTQPLSVGQKTPGTGFEVKLAQSANEDLKFNYLIVNKI